MRISFVSLIIPFKCEEALTRGGSGEFRVRELSKSSDVSRKKAASVAKEQRWEASTNAGNLTSCFFLRNEIFLVRPEMNPSVAKRMIAANLDSVIAKQIRSAEREERALKVKHLFLFLFNVSTVG